MSFIVASKKKERKFLTRFFSSILAFNQDYHLKHVATDLGSDVARLKQKMTVCSRSKELRSY